MYFFPGIFPPGSFSGLTDRVVTRSKIIGIKIGIDISRFIDHIFSSCAISIRFMLHIVFIHRCRPVVLPIIIRTPYPQGETIVHRIGKTLIHCIGIKGCRSFLIRCLFPDYDISVLSLYPSHKQPPKHSIAIRRPASVDKRYTNRIYPD